MSARQEENINKIDGSKLSQEEYLKTAFAQIKQIVGYCRTKEAQVKGFGHECLDGIAKETEMQDDLKQQIKALIDDPTKEFKITTFLK